MGTRRYGHTLWPSLVFVLAACSNGSGSLDDEASPPPASGAQTGLTIGGSVAGLSGGNVVLQNNGAGDLQVAADGAFTFAGTVSSGAAYDVKVSAQPTTPPQTCTVANGAGTVASANVTNIVVTCSTAPRYTIRVTVTGLAGSGLVLQNNATDSLSIPTNGNYLFATALTAGSAYSVTVGTQPNGQNCVVRNATGSIASANVTNVEVACVANQFSVGGSVSGLRGSGLVLQLNGANDLSLVNDGPFAFPIALANGVAYSIAVKTGSQPKTPSQTCAIAKGAGTVNGANVGDVAVTCTTNTFTIGGTLSGLAGKEVVLMLNGANDLKISANGAFTFAKALASGTDFQVGVKQNPKDVVQECTVSQPTTTVADANVTNVVVTCATATYSVGGRVLDLAGQGLRLSNNGGDPIDIAAPGGDFSFPTKIASGGTYRVEVARDPTSPSQACSVTGGQGTVTTGAVNNIVVRCSTATFRVGGQVNGLLGSGLELSNGADRVQVAAAGPFTFPQAVPSGSTYNVGVARDPTNPKQTCTVNGTTGTGSVVDQPVTSIVVDCVTDGFLLSVKVTGMRGETLGVTNNGVEALSIVSDGSYTFPTPLLSGSSYSVAVTQQPATFPLPTVCYVNPPGTESGTITDRAVELIVSCF